MFMNTFANKRHEHLSILSRATDLTLCERYRNLSFTLSIDVQGSFRACPMSGVYLAYTFRLSLFVY